MVAKVSEEEFIRVWREEQSPTRVAHVIGTSTRNAMERRNRIESKLGIVLPVDDSRTSAKRRVKVVPQSAVINVTLENGTILVGSDAHIWPGPLTTMQRAFIAFAKKLKPDVIVANGDFCDFPAISRWPSLSWNDLERKPSVKDEIHAVQEYMRELEAAAPSAYRAWPAGNHDLRFAAKLIASAPDYVGVTGMELKDHFPLWNPCWRVDVNDDIVIRHRELGGEHADFRNAQSTGRTLVTGHDHRTGVTPYRNYAGVKYGVRCGYLRDDPSDVQFVEYLEARTPNWHPAFVVLTIRDGGLLYPELVTKHADGVVQFRGELIKV